MPAGPGIQGCAPSARRQVLLDVVAPAPLPVCVAGNCVAVGQVAGSGMTVGQVAAAAVSCLPPASREETPASRDAPLRSILKCTLPAAAGPAHTAPTPAPPLESGPAATAELEQPAVAASLLPPQLGSVPLDRGSRGGGQGAMAAPCGSRGMRQLLAAATGSSPAASHMHHLLLSAARERRASGAGGGPAALWALVVAPPVRAGAQRTTRGQQLVQMVQAATAAAGSKPL